MPQSRTFNSPQLKEIQLQKRTTTQEVLLKLLRRDLTMLKRLTIMLKVLSRKQRKNLTMLKPPWETPTLPKTSLLTNMLKQLWTWKMPETNSKAQEDARLWQIWPFKMRKTLCKKPLKPETTPKTNSLRLMIFLPKPKKFWMTRWLRLLLWEKSIMSLRRNWKLNKLSSNWNWTNFTLPKQENKPPTD